LIAGCATFQHHPIIKADTEDCKLVYNNITNIVAKNIATYDTDAENNALREMVNDQFHASGDYDRFMKSCTYDASVEQAVCGSHAQTLDTVSGCMKLLPSATKK
jgi:hypothetical protein